MNNRAIGVFDSGLGGLSVWREIAHKLPSESLIYFGDGLNCPYGSRSVEEIQRLSIEAVEWLVEQGVKMVVVACNTVTVAAIELLRERYPEIPFVGTEPAVKPAALTTQTGKIAVLATERSLESEAYLRAVDRYGADVEVFAAVGEGFVELVESGELTGERAYEMVARVVEPLIEKGVDRVVLGCTHYPFLMEHFIRVIGDREVEVMDPSEAIARRVEQLLDLHSMRAEGGKRGSYRFHTLGSEEYIEMMRRVAGVSVK